MNTLLSRYFLHVFCFSLMIIVALMILLNMNPAKSYASRHGGQTGGIETEHVVIEYQAKPLADF